MAPDGGRTIRSSQQIVSRFVEVTTNGVSSRQRLDFWRDTVLKRTRPTSLSPDKPFRARLRRIVIDGAELVEHESDAVSATRAPTRTRFDGGDDIAIELMRDCDSASLEHNGEHRLRPGDLYVVDYACPLQVVRSWHRASGIVLPRRRVVEVLGEDLSALAGKRIAATGLAAVLRHHMQAAIDEAPRMTAEERSLAVRVAAEMGLAVLKSTKLESDDADRFREGVYHAACQLIGRECTDPDLTPDKIATTLRCSRASLYRVFARNDKSVAAAIWSARIERAWRVLTSAEGAGLLVADVAYLCGFSELPTFTRMFRRRYGLTPSDAREVAGRSG